MLQNTFSESRAICVVLWFIDVNYFPPYIDKPFRKSSFCYLFNMFGICRYIYQVAWCVIFRKEVPYILKVPVSISYCVVRIRRVLTYTIMHTNRLVALDMLLFKFIKVFSKTVGQDEQMWQNRFEQFGKISLSTVFVWVHPPDPSVLKGHRHDWDQCLFTKIIWHEILIEFLQKAIQKCTNHFGKDWAINRAEITHKSLYL